MCDVINTILTYTMSYGVLQNIVCEKYGKDCFTQRLKDKNTKNRFNTIL